MNDLVRYEKRDNIGLVIVNYPPVNAFAYAVRVGMVECFEKAIKDSEVQAIVLQCEGRTWFAGADISEFGKPEQQPGLVEVTVAFDHSSKPVVSAIHGTALGGGLEIALSCNYRVAAPGTRLGLPEVTLGILPGAGGTQRAPRAVGVTKALEMITSGKPVLADEAKQIGLIDEVITGDLLEGAIAFAKKLVSDKAPLRRLGAAAVDAKSFEPGIFDEYRKTLAKTMKNRLSPQRCVDAVEAATKLSFEDGLKKERVYFEELINSVEAKALRHLFFAEREVAKIPDIGKDILPREIKSVAVIGAGTMGGGITMNFVQAGMPVTLIEAKEDNLKAGIARIKENYDISAKKGRYTEAQVAEFMARITPSLSVEEGVKNVDLIVEAVFEEMSLKKDIFAKIDANAKPGAIIGSNTSTLDLDEIAQSIKRASDVIGLHFFSPANVMRLLEIVRPKTTSKDVMATAMSIAKTIKKVGVQSGVCYGFIGNRMLEGYCREADMLLLEGATPEQVDAALVGFGMAMGPIAMQDMAGIDVGFRIRESRREHIPNDERYYLLCDSLAKQGRMGQKTNKGFYKYEAGNRKPINDPEVLAFIEGESKRLGIKRREISEQEIIERCVLPLINEAALILEEGIALRPGDIDIVWTNGYGFPGFRGGPMFYADTLGVKKVHELLVKYQDQTQDKFGYWKPAPLIEKLAKQGKSFGGE
ncbi:MAG: enoyl-CoA hydratase/isomerase family protein [Gammaproteobacteria bacterium]|nr:enoyl-CoA hydratase/isomerase family protein [Gammaproteobacteria bacterium]